MSLTEYATWLNAHGWLTRRGKRWTATQVRRVFKRLSLVKRPSVV
ncbi:TPA: recombinase family protein [Stenotrophomonas maltophilia]|nr:recombinase family protein [Stenotrophomonas maltophilia]